MRWIEIKHDIIADLFTRVVYLIDRYGEKEGCPQMVEHLAGILSHPGVSRAIDDSAPHRKNGRATLFERVGGVTILGHHHPESAWSQPHDHGSTWAIYGVVAGKTAMYDYRLVGEGVELTRSYWIMPGQAHWYPSGAIHSHCTHEDTKLIRIEGMNLWRKSNVAGGKRYKLNEGN